MVNRKSVKDIMFSSSMTVDLIKSSASDSLIVQSARVSTAGEKSLIWTNQSEELEGLINYLMRDRHGSPFEHCSFTFYVKAPIFVWREHMRHRIASYNEESGRYKELAPEFYIPSEERNLVQVGKPGAYVFEPGTKFQYANVLGGYMSACKASYNSYLGMLEVGIAREVARGVLPLNIYSSAYVTINARSLMNFLSLRRNVEGQKFPSFPQREIEMVAEKYEKFFAEAMPITYKAFVDNGRVAP